MAAPMDIIDCIRTATGLLQPVLQQQGLQLIRRLVLVPPVTAVLLTVSCSTESCSQESCSGAPTLLYWLLTAATLVSYATFTS